VIDVISAAPHVVTLEDFFIDNRKKGGESKKDSVLDLLLMERRRNDDQAKFITTLLVKMADDMGTLIAACHTHKSNSLINEEHALSLLASDLQSMQSTFADKYMREWRNYISVYLRTTGTLYPDMAKFTMYHNAMTWNRYLRAMCVDNSNIVSLSAFESKWKRELKMTEDSSDRDASYYEDIILRLISIMYQYMVNDILETEGADMSTEERTAFKQHSATLKGLNSEARFSASE